MGEYFEDMPYSDEPQAKERKITRRRHNNNNFEAAKRGLENITKSPITPLSDFLRGGTTMPFASPNVELNKTSSISVGNVIINESRNGVVTWDNIVQSIQNVNSRSMDNGSFKR